MNDDDILAALEGFGEEPSPSQEPPTVEMPPKTVLFPGVLPDPLEPNEQILAMGVVDLRSLRSALYLLQMQIAVAIGSVEQLEHTQLVLQDQLKKGGK
jgi:hypothetical protein